MVWAPCALGCFGPLVEMLQPLCIVSIFEMGIRWNLCFNQVFSGWMDYYYSYYYYYVLVFVVVVVVVVVVAHSKY